MHPKLVGALFVGTVVGILAIVLGLKSDAENSALIVFFGFVALGGVGLVLVGGYLESRK
jgi:hypothetical protein